jgi:hypothetical protein
MGPVGQHHKKSVMEFTDYLKSQVKSVKPVSGHRFSPASSFVVTDVSDNSVGTLARVRPGDYLCEVDGRPAESVNLDSVPKSGQWSRFLFYRPHSEDFIEIRTTGLPTGIKAERTTEAMVARAQSLQTEPEEMMRLCLRQQWQALAQVCAACRGKGIPFLKRFSLRRRLKSPDPVVVFFEGIAAIETGNPKGLEAVRWFYDEHVHNWTMDYRALCGYYRGRELEDRELGDEALELYGAAYEDFELPVIADAIERLSGRRPEPTESSVGQGIEIDYELPRLDERGGVSLSRTLERMDTDQFLIIALLSGYRSNGPYSDYMFRLAHEWPYFRDYIGGIHIITETPEIRADLIHTRAGEEVARAYGVPLEMLHDETGEVHERFPPRKYAPEFFYVNRNGTIVEHSRVEGADTYRCMAQLRRAAKGALGHGRR